MLTRLWRRLRQQDRVEELERENDDLLHYRDWVCVYCDAEAPLPSDHWRECPNHPARDVIERHKQALASLLDHVEKETCTHEETYRAEMIWEVCHTCGARWADDDGGKPKFKWPEAVTRARAILGEEHDRE